MQRSLECVSEFPLGSTGQRCRMSWIRRRQFTSDVVGHTRCCIDGMCPESWGGDILSQKWVGRSVPLQLQETLGMDHFCCHEPGQTEDDTWTFLAP